MVNLNKYEGQCVIRKHVYKMSLSSSSLKEVLLLENNQCQDGNSWSGYLTVVYCSLTACSVVFYSFAHVHSLGIVSQLELIINNLGLYINIPAGPVVFGKLRNNKKKYMIK